MSTGLRLLLRFARPHRASLVIGTVLGVVGSLVALAQPLVARAALAAVAADGPVWPPVLVLLVAATGGAVLAGVQMFVLKRAGERIVLALRTSLVRRLLRWRVREHDDRSTGDLLSRVGSDTTQLRLAISTGLFDAASSAVMVVGALAVMAWLDWVQLLVVIGLLLVLGFGVLPALRRISVATRSAQDSLGRMTAELERVLGALRTVKACTAERRESDRITELARETYRAGVRSSILDAVVAACSAHAVQISFLVVLAVGGTRVAVGAISAADLVAFLLYVMYLAAPVVVISSAATQLRKASAAASRVAELDVVEVEPAAPRRPAVTAALKPPTVTFENVSFGYRAGVPVLRGLDFEIPAGARAAIVGRSGTGKSTVFALLERFYEPDAGRILLDATDIRDIPLDELRRRIGYVEQDAPVLAGTLRENLLYGRPDADETDLADAVAASQLGDLVARLPRGLDTEVGERGARLSGGERQRVAVGRLLLRSPRVVLLDEATSQLDSVNESALRAAIDELATRCTVIIVAHRLSTIARCDTVLLLDDGTVRREGTHDGLIASDTLYRDLAGGALHDEPAGGTLSRHLTADDREALPW